MKSRQVCVLCRYTYLYLCVANFYEANKSEIYEPMTITTQCNIINVFCKMYKKDYIQSDLKTAQRFSEGALLVQVTTPGGVTLTLVCQMALTVALPYLAH